MSGASYNFAFAIGEPVRIAAINEKGTVVAVTANVAGQTYRVVWWSEGTRKDEWLHDWEIEHA